MNNFHHQQDMSHGLLEVHCLPCHDPDLSRGLVVLRLLEGLVELRAQVVVAEQVGRPKCGVGFTAFEAFAQLSSDRTADNDDARRESGRLVTVLVLAGRSHVGPGSGGVVGGGGGGGGRGAGGLMFCGCWRCGLVVRLVFEGCWVCDL